MDPQGQYCPNLACAARGQVDGQTVRIHSRKDGRYYCTVCGQRWSARAGTMFARLHYPEAVVVQVVTLIAHGCPLQAIVVAFGIDERTVASWVEKAGQQCRRVHEQVVLGTAQDLGQVQVDEIRVRIQAGIVWLALALALAVPTRLWLGGVVSPTRDKHMARAVAAIVRTCALCRALLVTFDGFAAYPKAFLQALRSPVHDGRRGRPRRIAWPEVALGQVIKQTLQRRVVAVERHLLHGDQPLLQRLLHVTQGGGVINTAFIERLNASWRATFAPLVRRSRALARSQTTITAGMYLLGCFHNFCHYHEALAVELAVGRRRRWLRRTPAIAAGLTDHCWTPAELLSFKLPPPPWVPPKPRGRPSKAVQQARAPWT
jgi:transposase-like protein